MRAHRPSQDTPLFLAIMEAGRGKKMPDNGDGGEGWKSAAQIRIWMILGIMILIGVVSAIGAEHIPQEWIKRLVVELGSGLFTAGILGLTVDTFFKRQFARDVFQAAFRYVLRPELKEEVGRIIGYKLLCIRHLLVVEITPMDADHVRVTIKVERDIENISRHPEPIRNLFQIDEWGVKGHKSHIEMCSMDIDSEHLDAITNTNDRPDRVSAHTEERKLRAGHIAKVVSAGHEIRSRNDELFMAFNSPTVNPVVRVVIPDGYKHECTFGVPGEVIISSAISRQHELAGTQFPGQHTRIRWWPDAH